MVEGMLATFRDPERTREALIASVPLKRLGRAEEVADLLVYLVSDESQFVTGAEFVIDGGMTAA
jgi:NAD(P)-dependent dehydrogenase (short-subunit alcohol dehydrogenase family)